LQCCFSVNRKLVVGTGKNKIRWDFLFCNYISDCFFCVCVFFGSGSALPDCVLVCELLGGAEVFEVSSHHSELHFSTENDTIAT